MVVVTTLLGCRLLSLLYWLCTTPTNLSSSSVTPSSATISWDAVTGAQYYIYSTRIIGATGWVDDTTTSTSVSLTGLSFLSEC